MSMAEQLFAIGVLHTFALLSPGPDFSALLQICLKHPRSRAVFCALGITAGMMFHLFCTLVGVSALLAVYPQLYFFIQVLGAAYLFYLGLKILFSTWRQSPNAQASVTQSKVALSLWQAFRYGLMTNVLNPKAAVYFLSLISQVIPVGAGLVWKLSFSGVIIGLTSIWFNLVAILFTLNSIKHGYAQFQIYIDRVLGTLLIGFALHLALSI